MAAVEQDITAEQGAALAVTLTGAGASLNGRTLRMHVRSKVGVITTRLTASTGDGRLTVGADPYTTAALAIGSDVMAAVSVTLPVEYWVYDVESYTTAADVRREWFGRWTITRDVTRDTEADTEDSLAGLVRYDTPQSLTATQAEQAWDNISGDELARDAIGAALVAGSNVTITVSDAGDTITIASSGGGGGSAAWGDITGTLSAQTDLSAALALKAPLASPTLTGTPAAPTAAGGTSTTQIATTAFAAGEITTHAGATDPHGDRAFATSAVSTHAALTTGVHGLGGASQLNVGTTAGTVAAGDHAHAGVYQPLATVLTNTTASFTTAQETKLSGIEAAADVTDAGNVGTAIDGATAKATPVDADTVALIDSAASNVLKKLSWANIKATLKTYFDTLYQAVLVSGTNIKTVNSTSLLGSGDIAISGLTGFTAAENTSAPNATVPVASLTANNAATNVDAALRPKGTGAVLAHVPDSTATGGNKRGASAVDLQTSRSTAAQVASGGQSVIAGGGTNTCSGAYAAVSGGGSNAASGNYANVAGGQSNLASGTSAAVGGGFGNTASGSQSWVPGGRYGITRGIYGAGAYAAGIRVTDGDRQTMLLPISCAARTDATAAVMTSDAGAASAANQMVLPNNSSMFFEVDVVAHDSALKSASWKVQGTIRRGANAAATAIVGTNVTTTFGSDLSGGAPGVTCTADTTNGALAVTFTGIAATTIYPSGHIRTVIAA